MALPKAGNLACAAALVLAACKPVVTPLPSDSVQLPDIAIGFELISKGLNNPVAVTHAGDDSGRLFVTEQHGTVAIIRNGHKLPEPFLDIRSRVSCCGETGFLSMAFHPRYQETGYVYVNYTNLDKDTVIARYQVSDNPDQIDPGSAYPLLTIKQTAQIHNGGQLQFGPDGYLYIGMGDGGSFGSTDDEDSGGDPHNRAQNKTELLGKLLRLDVDHGTPYGIPDDNPFKGWEKARPEIWALGFRNPWRFSFDRETGDLFISDVGETKREEINFQPANSKGGENYGWRRMEGNLCFKPTYDCNDGSLVLPIIEYGHYSGCAIIGGYRYRGSAFPDLVGTYLYADFCTSSVFGAWPSSDNAEWRSTLLRKASFSITSFGEDQQGEVYITSFGGENGALYRLTSDTTKP
ncbi:FIG01022095: hypothetical protein [hydrothermal vent metagenome]|uniref:Glucose/Sorbosone dehydrogenase domain-containing protein n=1 Tax=hydrothermal vent metagenome TaxID=652676 RepID=A0A3B0YVG7_9ZZZZ